MMRKRFHRRTPRWTWGVLAVTMLLVLPGRAMVLGTIPNHRPRRTQSTRRAPTKCAEREEQLASMTIVSRRWPGLQRPTMRPGRRSGRWTWSTSQTDLVCERKTAAAKRMGGPCRLKAGNRERLRQSSMIVCQLRGEKTLSERFEYDDYCLDGLTVRQVREYGRKTGDRGALSVIDPKRLVGYVYTEKPRLLVRRSSPVNSPEVLRYFQCWHDDPPLTLAEIIAAWKVTLKGQTATDGEGNPVVASCGTSGQGRQGSDDRRLHRLLRETPTGVSLQKAIMYEPDAYLIGDPADGKSVGVCHSLEVKEFQPCGDGIFFPKRVECRKQIGVERISADGSDCLTFVAMKLSVNSPLGAMRSIFAFPPA